MKTVIHQTLTVALLAWLGLVHGIPTTQHDAINDVFSIEHSRIAPRAEDSDYLLPTNLSPENYTVILAPYIEEGNFTIDGFVHMNINVINNTNAIVLNAKDLDISSINVTVDSIPIVVTSQSFDNDTDILTINLNTTLAAGSSVEVAISYVGILNDDMTGFYRSFYIDANGNKRWIATTQFQPTYARQAFPCFDEPSFKAKFQILINYASEYHALSNMPRVNTTGVDESGRITDVFDWTPVMSTYLLAFIVSDFDNSTNTNGNFTVWARPNAIDQADYALELGPQVLAYLTNTLGIDYPLPKMDMAALSDFDWGAMENWGLVTYRETAMLYDENHSSATNKARVATVVAHELTHMWFGNLVTLKRWDYAWLNEGFARRFQYLATDAIETSWGLRNQFLVEQHQVVFQNDGIDSAHPLNNPVYTTSAIRAHFSTISYNKGASIIRMMENIFGEEIFYAALHDYLDTNSYDNTVPDDLWTAIQGQADSNNISLSNQTVATVMDTWTSQAGYPVITVNFDRATGYAEISQERFFLRTTASSENQTIWWVPINFVTESNPNFENTTVKYWLGNESASIQVSNASEGWVIFNVQEYGYYRVNYDSESWTYIVNVLNSDAFDTIDVLNRAQILDDVLNLARGNYISYETALSVAQYVTREKNYIPWKALFNGFEYLNRRFLGQDIWDSYKTYVLTIIDDIYNDLGFNDKTGEDWLDTLNRRLILEWACNFEHADCISNSLEQFAAYKANTSNFVSANQRYAVFCTAIKYGTSDDWYFLWNQYDQMNVAAAKITILQALGCSQNYTILYEYLHYLLEDDRGIRPQDMSTVYSSVYAYGGLVGVEATLDFAADYHEEIEAYYGSLSYVSSIFSGASLRLSTQELIDKFSGIIEANQENFTSISSSLVSQLTLAQRELNWYSEHSATIAEWLADAITDSSSTTDYRLPTNIIPESYVIYLTPYFDNFTFGGVVNIIANVESSTNQIILHANEITYTNISVTENTNQIGITNITYLSTYHFIVIDLNSTLSNGSVVTINVEYTGILNDNMEGFYRSAYTNASGQIKWLASTQMQPTYARQVFPCFDEPAMKATFIIHVNRPETYHTISNMPLNYSSATTDGLVRDTFEETVRMSTYLLAIIVSDFDSLTNETANHSVWARPNAIDQAEYALSIMPPLVNYFENLLDHKYPLSKLDMAAIPDFSAGAMENWGLLTYRETRMLVGSNDTSASDKQVIANVISHEITHQWFGNLVSPQWWNYLWLSEGFARYYQYHATAEVETTWGLAAQFVVEQMQVSYGVDGLTSTHAMNYDVWSPSQVSGIFDTISYAKAASILRMMEKTFGSELFANALHEYLEARQYDYVIPGHLWEAFQTQVNSSNLQLDASVETIMNTWVTQAGFPVINVTINGTTVTLSQSQFLLRNTVGATTAKTWWIPISWATEDTPDFSNTSAAYWLFTETDTITLPRTEDAWTIFNIQESGYYRVNYDDESWNRIISGLKGANFTDIHELNRASTIDDLLNLGRAGYVNYEIVLNATQYLAQETNYIPWRAAFNGLAYLNRRLAGQEAYALYQTHVLTILDSIYEKLGFTEVEGEDYFDTLLRTYVLSWACNFGHEGCIATSREMFVAWRANSSAWIPANIREVVYCTAIKYGSSEDWSFLWEQYQQTNVATEHIVILNALGCSQNTTILHEFLEYAISDYADYGIRRQDSTTAFAAIYASGLVGVEYVLNFVNGHKNDMYAYYGSYSSIASILSGVSLRLSTQELIDQFELFIENNSENFSTIVSSLQSSLTLAKYELNWFEENSPIINAWLSNVYEDTSDTSDTSATTDYRLPTDIIPSKYEIFLTPYIEDYNFTFDGTVYITANVNTTTNRIVLHADEIEWLNITVTGNSIALDIQNITYESTYDFLIIQLTSNIAENTTLTISITYTGTLNTVMRGFFRSYYLDASGAEKWLAATHLEPTGARKTFPCFDEPALKATFVIHVSRPADYNTLSNMPLNYSSSAVDGRVWDTFEESVKMSTYLVAVVVSDFTNLTEQTADYTYGVWARPNAIDQAEYALSIMDPLVSYFENALNHTYQLSKLDMVALPDFRSGAMENWGLLTYRETRSLIGENDTSASAKQAIGTVISHEITHQWFGDLVSPQWWKYLWLNEGFARYYQYHATATVETTWGLESQFVVEQMQISYATDGLTSSHAMTYDVWNPTQIRGIFDTISYAKAASVIRMMEKIFGSTVFYDALYNYLEARQYDVATPEHLWEALQSSIEKYGLQLDTTVNTIMDTWVTQAGLPVVGVTVANGTASFSQERFLLRNYVNASIDNVWWVPLTWTTGSNPDFNSTTPKAWLNNSIGSVEVDVASDEWIIFNIQEAGYYRVNYDTQSWSRIIAALNGDNFTAIHEINRASIIDDLFNLARAGYIDYETLLSATQYLTQETNHIPWTAFFNGIAYLNRRFNGREIYDLYKQHILTILGPIYEKLGFFDIDGEDYYDTLLRANVLETACKFDHDDCLATSLELFAAWRANSSATVPVNQRSAVYCTAIRHGSSEDWDFLWQEFLSTNVATEETTIISALGCSQNTTILHDYLWSAISGEIGIRIHDSTSVFSSVYTSSLSNAEYTLEFVGGHYEYMYSHFYSSHSDTSSIISAISARFSTDELVDKFEEFIDTYSTGLSSIASSLQSYLTLARYELSWYESKSPEILTWLTNAYETEVSYRLPKLIVPDTYELYISPNFTDNNFTFYGEVEILMMVLNSTSEIVLHASELTIHDTRIYQNSTTDLTIASTAYDSITHKLTITLSESLAAGSSVSAYFSFTGILNDEMQGLYRSYYVDDTGTTRWIATTQFQPTHARKVFPCFDEPSFKAKFTINIERPTTYHSISNTPLNQSIASTTDGLTWDTFEQTVTMSTYLVAFIVSDFESIQNDAGNFSVWARSNAIEHADYSLRIGQEVLRFLEEYTGIEYPLEKMDMAAIPDFSAGAMENWGLVTYREYGLLANDNVTSVTYKKYINTIIAHELVHMWFGNLVTCEWWDYTWLNEGFAQYYQFVAGNATEPEWNLLQQFVVYQLQTAMETDASASIRAMNNDVSTPSEISSGFDTIAYAKSASVIRMMQHSFGADKFAAALHNYLEANQYSTANPNDLYSAIQNQVDGDNLVESVATIMGSWAEQSGYPVVNASLSSGVLTLTQERFLLTRTASSEVNYTFWIPITYTTASDPDFESTTPNVWFGNDSMTINLGISDEWFLLNIQEVGYYRVNYDTDSWERIIDLLWSTEFATIHALNRAQILDDLLNFARSGYVDYGLALNATLYLTQESSHLPFRALFNGLTFLTRRFKGQDSETLLKQHILAVISNVYESVGLTDIDGEGQLDELNRNLIVTSACTYGHASCIEQAQRLFAAWRANSTQWIVPNIRTAVYCTALRYGTYEDWQFLWDQYLTSNFASEQVIILNALGCTTNTTTLSTYLLNAISSEGLIRSQDVSSVFSSVYGAGDEGLEYFFTFITNNYNELYEYYESWSSVSSLFSAVATRLSTEIQIDMLETFINNNDNLITTNLSSLDSYLTSAKTNLAWYETYSPTITAWLESHYAIEDTTTTNTTISTTTTSTTTTSTTTASTTTASTTTTSSTTTSTTTTTEATATTEATTSTPTTSTPTTTAATATTEATTTTEAATTTEATTTTEAATTTSEPTEPTEETPDSGATVRGVNVLFLALLTFITCIYTQN